MENYPNLSKLLNTQNIHNVNETLTPITESSPDADINKRKAHHVQHCAAINCKNNRFDNPDKAFFLFQRMKKDASVGC